MESVSGVAHFGISPRGVLAYVVGLRRPEFGIRLAMGPSGAHLRRMVVFAAAGATWLPARRASRVHPAEPLREG